MTENCENCTEVHAHPAVDPSLVLRSIDVHSGFFSSEYNWILLKCQFVSAGFFFLENNAHLDVNKTQATYQ